MRSLFKPRVSWALLSEVCRSLDVAPEPHVIQIPPALAAPWSPMLPRPAFLILPLPREQS